MTSKEKERAHREVIIIPEIRRRFVILTRCTCPDFNPEECAKIVFKDACHQMDPLGGLCPYLWADRN